MVMKIYYKLEHEAWLGKIQSNEKHFGMNLNKIGGVNSNACLSRLDWAKW